MKEITKIHSGNIQKVFPNVCRKYPANIRKEFRNRSERTYLNIQVSFRRSFQKGSQKAIRKYSVNYPEGKLNYPKTEFALQIIQKVCTKYSENEN